MANINQLDNLRIRTLEILELFYDNKTTTK